MNASSQNWSKEVIKRRVRFAYGDSLASEDRNDGDVPVFGSNGIVGTHDRSITFAPAIIIGRKGSAGRVTWSDVPCFPIDTTYFVDQTQTRENMRWLFYALESLELDKINFDSAVPGLSRELAYSLPLVFPPLHEQERLAAYLDKTCSAIDTAIEKKQKQLETLDALRKSIIHKAVTRGLDDSVELKDSGAEWIGKVPKHWQCTRLKNVAEVNAKTLPATATDDYVLRYLEISNVNSGGIVSENEIEEMSFIDAPSRARRIVRNNDTVISSVRPNLQAVAYIEKASDNLIASTGFYVISPNSYKLYPKYIYYLLLAENIKQYLEAAAKGVGYPAVDDKDFTTVKFYLPPIPEQRQIVDYLEKKIAVLYDVQKNLTGQITDLEQYRKSLIHECVTGKRRITEADMKGIHQN